MKLLPAQSVCRLAAIIVSLTFSLAPLTGCSQGAETGGESTANIDVPPIYVAQTLVMKEAGESMVEKSYRQLLKACHDAAMATTPLSEDDVKRLGRTYYQLWFDSKHSAWQIDVWDFGAGDDPNDSCQFHMENESRKVVITAKTQLSIDLMAKTATSIASSGFMPGGPADPDDDDRLDAAAEKTLGIQRLGYATDAGQRCLRWRMNDTESCTWSDGRKWGFPEGENSNQATSYDPGDIVLWVHPGNAPGFELTTQKMTVGGEPFDDDVFAPPSGVSVKKGGS